MLSGGATEPGAIAVLGLGWDREAAAVPMQGRRGSRSVECSKCREIRSYGGFCIMLEGCAALFIEVKHTPCTQLFLVWDFTRYRWPLRAWYYSAVFLGCLHACNGPVRVATKGFTFSVVF